MLKKPLLLAAVALQVAFVAQAQQVLAVTVLRQRSRGRCGAGGSGVVGSFWLKAV